MIQALGMYLDTPHYTNEIITIWNGLAKRNKQK
jgi:hypothetical protein